MTSERIAELRTRLENVQKAFDASGEICNDPIALVLRYDHPLDREVTALIGAALAYGNVKQIQNSLRNALAILGDHPAEKLKSSTGNHWKSEIPRSFKHRFNTADDLGLFFTWIGEALRRSGSLQKFFGDARGNSEFIDPALNDFVRRFTSLPGGPYKIPKSKGAKFFIPAPSDKSACKRPLLFLRWVAGTGPMDLKLWSDFPREKLVIPLDTHVLRIARHLGLTTRKDSSWRTAIAVTRALKQLDPQDPTRFDFALCHLGISQECPSRFNTKICNSCQMNSLCVTFKRRASPKV